MQRILILGGGVGGTLTANLLVKKLRRQVKAGEVTITVVDQTGLHTYQPGFMYIATGGERAERLQRPERGLLDSRVALVVAEIDKVDEPSQTVHLRNGERLAYDYLVLATGSRIVPEAIEHFDTEAQHFYTRRSGARAPPRPRRLHWRADRGGDRRHAVQVPARPTRGVVPHRERAP